MKLAVVGLILGLLPDATARAAEGCSAQVDLASLDRVLQEAEDAFRDVENDVFTDRLKTAAEMIPCLSQVATPASLAHYYRLRGVRAYGSKQQVEARQFFSAAHAAAPDVAFDLMPSGHPAEKLFQEGAGWPDERTPIAAPPQGQVYVDGVADQGRPVRRPTVVQQATAPDQVLLTALVLPGDDLPGWTGGGAVADNGDTDPKPPGKHPRLKRVLLVGTVGSGVVALGGAALAAQTFASYPDPADVDKIDPDNTYESKFEAQLSRTYQLNHLGGGLALGAGGLAVAGAAALVVIRF